MQKKPLTATYFKCLTLENVRSFGKKQCLNLIDERGNLARWTLLLGDNGVGKTTLLQCLGWMRPGYEGSANSKKIGIGPALPSEENDVLEGLLRVGKKAVFKMCAEICQGAILDAPPPKSFSTKINASFRNRQLISAKPSWISEKAFKKNFDEFKEPFIIAYGANRQMGEQNITKNELKDPIATRLSGLTELYDINQALIELDYAARGKKRRGKEQKLLENLLYSLATILPDNKTKDDIEIITGEFVDDKFKLSTVNLRTFSGLVPISALSIGYRTMLAWILDLTWRLSLEYPDSKNPRDEPAIVLIDEIDLHLHPHWQIKLMDILGNLFKSTQFIATAHSPLMVQSKPNANFAVIKQSETEVIVENDPGTVRGWRVDQILNSNYFNIYNSRDPDTQKLYDQRDRLFNKAVRTSTEETELKQVEEKILSLPTASDPDDIEAMKLIREAALLLKTEKAKKDDSN